MGGNTAQQCVDLSHQLTSITWKDMLMGGLAHAFFSLVVAISSTEATRALSVCPVKRLIFQTRACFLASYLAFPEALQAVCLLTAQSINQSI